MVILTWYYIIVIRCTPDNIHIISINTGEDNNEEVSGVLLSNKTQRVKPAIPDKPKDISFAVRNIIRKKEAAISDKDNKLSINPTKRVNKEYKCKMNQAFLF